MNAPGQRAHAADDDDNEDDRPDGACHRRLGDERVAADHAGQPGQRGAAAEDQHEYPGHVVTQRLDLLRMRQRRLDHEADARPRQHQPDRASMPTATAIMNMRYWGNVMPSGCSQATGPSSSTGTR